MKTIAIRLFFHAESLRIYPFPKTKSAFKTISTHPNRSTMKMLRPRFSILLFAAMTLPALAQEREVTEEQKEAIQNGGEVEAVVERPKNLPDLTKGEKIPEGRFPLQV